MSSEDEPHSEEQVAPNSATEGEAAAVEVPDAEVTQETPAETTDLQAAPEGSSIALPPLHELPEPTPESRPEIAAEVPEDVSKQPARASRRIPGAGLLKKRNKEPAVAPPPAESLAEEAAAAEVPATLVPPLEEPPPGELPAVAATQPESGGEAAVEAAAAAVPGAETPTAEVPPPAEVLPPAVMPPPPFEPAVAARTGRSRLRSVVRYAVMILFLAGVAAVALVVFKSGVIGPPKASPSPTVTASPSPAFVWYKVKKGDTMGAILLKQHVASVDQVLELNPNLQLNSLRVGQRIKLPPPTQ